MPAGAAPNTRNAGAARTAGAARIAGAARGIRTVRIAGRARDDGAVRGAEVAGGTRTVGAVRSAGPTRDAGRAPTPRRAVGAGVRAPRPGRRPSPPPRLWAARIARAALAALLLAGSSRAAAEEVVVFAAASLMGALDDAIAPWEAETGHEARISHAGSAALARQIEQGAPAEVFVSANVAWMDALEAGGLLRPGSRRDLVSNRLVLVAHGAAAPVEVGPEVVRRLGDGPLAMALVDAVPAGIYGREALASAGLWDALAPRIAQSENVRASLALVARGEAPMGVVYATDARAEPGVSVMASFPEKSHAAIVYPAALVAGAGEAAASLLDHLASPEARAVFARHGFPPP